MAIEMAMTKARASRRCSIAEARHHLVAIVHEVEQGSHIEITRRGEPVAVIVPIADYVHSAKRKDFWKAYLDWKKGVDLRKLGFDGGFLKGVRDRFTRARLQLVMVRYLLNANVLAEPLRPLANHSVRRSGRRSSAV